MKKHYIIILFSLFILSISCKKNRLEQMEESLVGSWEIRREIGGQIAGAPDTFAPGNGRILQFTEKNYAYIIGTSVNYTGSYIAGVKGSGPDKEYTITFIDNGFPRFFRIENNKLTLYHGPEVADGNTLIYERVKDPILQTN